jgi:S-adenosylmethionine hydrolase
MITLTTDFGTSDGYVAAMKGVMLSIHPDARFVDVTHEVSPQDVMEAAFVLKSAMPYYPAGTVHLVVVDPGVGTDRRAVALRHGEHWFVGPDNGVFPLLLDDETPDAIVELDDPSAWQTDDPSTTFHGRDIFAPAAAHLDRGASLEEVGTPVESLQPLRWALPISDEHTVQGWVVHVDRFGNCITNIRRETIARAVNPDRRSPAPPRGPDAPEPDVDAPNADAPNADAPNADAPNADAPNADAPGDDAASESGDDGGLDDVPPLKGYAGSSVLEGLHRTYGDVAQGEPLMLFGSTGFLEVAVNGGDASELLDIRKGDTVKLVFQRPDTPTPGEE